MNIIIQTKTFTSKSSGKLIPKLSASVKAYKVDEDY